MFPNSFKAQSRAKADKYEGASHRIMSPILHYLNAHFCPAEGGIADLSLSATGGQGIDNSSNKKGRHS